MTINIDECEAAGFTPEQIKKIESIVRRMSRAAKEAQNMGIQVFGGTGDGTLRYRDSEDKGMLIIANLDGDFDGGDGGIDYWGDDLLRGES